MGTNGASALRTTPSHFFILDEFSYAPSFNVLKVFNHAHVVVGPISGIQMPQIIAGKFSAFKTKRCFSFFKNFAVFDFASDPGSWFIGVCPPAAGAFIFLTQVSYANATVHATWCDRVAHIFKFSARGVFILCLRKPRL